ncbi:hypothetical protein BTA51_15980 [Hahella sp. CCB-MM4]|uniref:hypothetical protein n=1 Tax=Hahella sp. (strain CCB-MM4) TaxID=1926491 RepID=UPI000B9AB325|nr:hypothetical protein [Hahella sp. CCB-MM4]OZG72241.1 hypothetical protein BTA51_15980 [Hahella sp. CCB-MM4]
MPSSKASEHMQRINSSGADSTVKAVCNAALATVGMLQWTKTDIPEFHNWKQRSADVKSTTGGINCWTACLFWAFQGGAINHSWLLKYKTAIESYGVTKDYRQKVTPKFMGYEKAVPVGTGNVAPPGSAIFFGGGELSPMNHVVLSIGDGYCVSTGQAMYKPDLLDKLVKLNSGLGIEDLYKGKTHIATIEIIREGTNFPPKVMKTPGAFWS